MSVSHKLKIQIFMDVTHPRLLYAKASGSTFPKLSVFTGHHSILHSNDDDKIIIIITIIKAQEV
jgi:hypothetical protein